MTYRTVVVDPPWPQKGRGRAIGKTWADASGPSLPMPYRTMTLDAIKALDIPAEASAHLYLWTTSGFLEPAFDILRAWGFRYSTTLVWTKAPKGGGLGGAHGIATEFVLFGRRGVLPATSRVGRNWWTWKRGIHSAKPDGFYSMVESVSPGPYLDMFARKVRPGWDGWGDEYPGPDDGR